MSHEVIWTDKNSDFFIDKACLSDDEAYIIKSRARGYTIQQQSEALSKSPQTISRMIAILKKKYDVVQKEYPNDLPVRRSSKIEKYMDNN